MYLVALQYFMFKLFLSNNYTIIPFKFFIILFYMYGLLRRVCEHECNCCPLRLPEGITVPGIRDKDSADCCVCSGNGTQVVFRKKFSLREVDALNH